jgi:hypothetical protein
MKAVLVGILVLLGALVFGFIAPALISEDDSLAVTLGFAVIMAYVFAVYAFLVHFVLSPLKRKS